MSSPTGQNGNSDSGNFTAFITGALIGGAIGTLLGMFLAPKSGTEIRHELSEGVHDAQNKTLQTWDETRGNLSSSFDKASSFLGETVKNLSQAFNAGRRAARESLSKSEEFDSEKSEG